MTHPCGWANLAVAYLLLSGLVGLMLTLRRIPWGLKVVVVTVVLWFGVVLLYVPEDFMGWPYPGTMPDKVIMSAFHVNEPTDKFEGAIYIWGPELRSPDTGDEITQNIMKYTPEDFSAPRVYRLDYDRELHKRLIEQHKARQKGMVGIPIFEKKQRDGKKPETGNGSQDLWESRNLMFRVINPVTMMPPKDGE